MLSVPNNLNTCMCSLCHWLPLLIAMFDSSGLGSVQHARSGAPWITTTDRGYKVSSEGGSVVEQGEGIRASAEPVM